MTTTADTIREMAAHGLKPSEIAHALGVTHQRVASALKARSRRRGRPKSEEACPYCGAAPAHRRDLKASSLP